MEKPRPEARISTLERSRPLNPDARPLKTLGNGAAAGIVGMKGNGSVAPPLPKPRKLKKAESNSMAPTAVDEKDEGSSISEVMRIMSDLTNHVQNLIKD